MYHILNIHKDNGVFSSQKFVISKNVLCIICTCRDLGCGKFAKHEFNMCNDPRSCCVAEWLIMWCENNFFFLLEIFFRQLRVSYFVAPSLTRGRVCNLLLLLLLASAVPLESESRGTQDHILLTQFLRLSQPGGPGPCIYIPQEQGGPVIPPGTGFPFRRLLRLAGTRWRYSIPPPHGL
jgi:hypothetical protein